MSNQELYQATFSQVHSSFRVDEEAFAQMRRKQRRGKRIFIAAAVIALLAALSTAAVAANWFGLRDWLIADKAEVRLPDEQGTVESMQVDVISLSGYQNTPEGMAAAEWQSFLNSYDPDGAILKAIGNGPTGLEERYSLYTVYSREMAERLDEIVEKYQLELHTQLIDAYEHPEVMDGIQEALGENQAYSAYFYEDGSFHFDGEYQAPGYGTLDYQFQRSVRGTFLEVILNVGDVSQYRDWTYETACGQAVTLALGPDKALVLADLGDSFVTLNVLAGTQTNPADIFSNGPITEEILEALADSVDYTKLTPAKPPVLRQEVENQGGESGEEDTIYVQTGIQMETAKAYAQNVAALMEQGDREAVAALLRYPCQVTVSSGVYTVETAEEFLDYYEEVIDYQLKTLLGELRNGDLFGRNGLVGVGDGTVWFGQVEDGDIRIMTIQGTAGWSVRAGE